MKKTITKLMGVATIAAALTAAQPAMAQCCPNTDPCCDPRTDWCDMCGDWEIGAHALYWTPVTCQFTYVIDDPDIVPGQVTQVDTSTVKCSGDWGFRVFGRYLSDCSFLSLSYQWFQSKTADSRTGPFLRTPGNQGRVDESSRVEARLRLEYQNVDLRWGKYLHRTCGCSFYVFGNAKWVDLSMRQSHSQKSFANDILTVQQVTQKSELQGGALGIGAGADFDLWCNFGIFGDANVLGVIAERSTKDVRDLTTNDGVFVSGNRVRYPSDTCINPEVDFRIGVNYRYTCGCWTFVGEIGYEVDYFWDAVAFPLAAPRSQSQESEWILKCQNVGFSGLFFGGRILF